MDKGRDPLGIFAFLLLSTAGALIMAGLPDSAQPALIVLGIIVLLLAIPVVFALVRREWPLWRRWIARRLSDEPTNSTPSVTSQTPVRTAIHNTGHGNRFEGIITQNYERAIQDDGSENSYSRVEAILGGRLKIGPFTAHVTDYGVGQPRAVYASLKVEAEGEAFASVSGHLVGVHVREGDVFVDAGYRGDFPLLWGWDQSRSPIMIEPGRPKHLNVFRVNEGSRSIEPFIQTVPHSIRDVLQDPSKELRLFVSVTSPATEAKVAVLSVKQTARWDRPEVGLIDVTRQTP